MQFIAWISKRIFFSNAKLIWWQHHIPWYHSEHTNIFLYGKRQLERFVIQDIDLLLASSQYLCKRIESIWNISAHTLYPYVDFELPSSLPERKKYVLFTYGRWVSGKNIDQVFQTYDALRPQISDLELWVG